MSFVGIDAGLKCSALNDNCRRGYKTNNNDSSKSGVGSGGDNKSSGTDRNNVRSMLSNPSIYRGGEMPSDTSEDG